MTQELNIEQLKFAREIGATHLDCEFGKYWKDGYIYIDGLWEDGLPANGEQIIKIDFSPLYDYYADKAVDIAATGGEVLPDAANDPEFNGVPQSAGEPLTWPISEELIGRKVRFDGYSKQGQSHWDYKKGEVYTIEDDNMPSKNYGFKFTLLPEQEIPDGYYHDDESGKLKPLKPVPAPDYEPADVAFKTKRSKYHREIKPGVWVDVYDVISAWGITNPAQQHLAKKALQAGDRGHKSYDEDMRDIIASAERAIDLFNDNERTAGVNE